MTEVSRSRLERPRGITTVAIFLIISGGLYIYQITGFEPNSNSFFETFSEVSTFEDGLSIYSFISSFLGFAIAGSILCGKRWGRTFLIILVVIDLGMQIPLFFLPGAILTIPAAILYGIMLWYLRKPHVKAYFNVG